MKNKDDLWDISNKPSTKTKLEILEKVFCVWLTIWNKQGWVQNEWYIIDLFAGRGEYYDNGEKRDGSPLIFLETINKKKDALRSALKFKIFLVEKSKKYFNHLKNVVEKYKLENSLNNIELYLFNDDCNNIITQITDKINNTNKNPLFVLVDPPGLQIKKTNMKGIIELNNPKDILFNYILEGVVRTSGVAKKKYNGKNLNIKELETVKTLEEFIGADINVVNASSKKVLEDYVQLFTSHGLNVVGYDIKYPNRDDGLYYLLFSSKKSSITNIVKDIYKRLKEKESGPTLFEVDNVFTVNSDVEKISRKSLLYKTKVEYGDWTVNHVVGCRHGCKFPCYAMMMAKRFGWVRDYDDWRNPKIVANALELLDKEIPKYKSQIDFVHLCFMTDPFMYDLERKQLIPEVVEMTLKIIERLNKEGIKVTTLTKGIYPEEISDKKKFLQSNEYGITLVSLNHSFKEKFEPYSAPYEERINSLRIFAQAGLNTWVSMEPYPPPEFDKTSGNIDDILEQISFVKKIIFGKLNYNRIANYTNSSVSVWKNNEEFYREMAETVKTFCLKNNIKYHIKTGTPMSKNATKGILKE